MHQVLSGCLPVVPAVSSNGDFVPLRRQQPGKRQVVSGASADPASADSAAVRASDADPLSEEEEAAAREGRAARIRKRGRSYTLSTRLRRSLISEAEYAQVGCAQSCG